jgi:hypothetical protein
MVEASSLRLTLVDRIILGVKSLILAGETRDVRRVLASTKQKKDVIDSSRQEVNIGNESSFVVDRLKCKKNDEEELVRKNDVEMGRNDDESNDGSHTIQDQNSLETRESEITENEKDEVVVYYPGQYDNESRS